MTYGRHAVSTISELKQTLSNLPAAELESIADWLGVFVEDAWYRTYHVREAQPEYISEDPLFMSFEEYMAFEETRPYRHEFVNGAVYAMSGASLAHNRIAKKLAIAFERTCWDTCARRSFWRRSSRFGRAGTKSSTTLM